MPSDLAGLPDARGATPINKVCGSSNCHRTEFIMKTTIPEPSTERLSLRQRIRLFWSTLERYAEALEQTPYDHLLDRIRRLEEDVKRIENSLPSKFVGDATPL